MIEVLWHGRGGQGAFTAARLLGAAASMDEGAYALAFPSFGPERRGAPMRAFTKMSDAPIGDRSAITRADYVVYLDDTLLASGWENELKPGGVALVNSAKPADALLAAVGGSPEAAGRLLVIDANGISGALLGRPIPNTVFLGALSILCDRVPVEAVTEAVRQYMAPKLHEKNLAIVAEARHATAQALVARAEARRAQGEGAGSAEGTRPAAGVGARAVSGASVSRETSAAGDPAAPAVGRSAEGAPASAELRGGAAPASPAPCGGVALAASAPLRDGAVAIPRLREEIAATGSGDAVAAALPSLDPRDFARSTCYQAGHLVTRNAGWRNERPLLAPALCTGCLQCYLYCPDGAIVRTHATKDQLSASDSAIAAVAFDYGFCKGCGVCVKACRFDAITMIPEESALAAERQAAAECAAASATPVGSPMPAGSPAGSPAAGPGAASGSAPAAGERLAGAFLSDYESEGGAR